MGFPGRAGPGRGGGSVPLLLENGRGERGHRGDTLLKGEVGNGGGHLRVDVPAATGRGREGGGVQGVCVSFSKCAKA